MAWIDRGCANALALNTPDHRNANFPALRFFDRAREVDIPARKLGNWRYTTRKRALGAGANRLSQTVEEYNQKAGRPPGTDQTQQTASTPQMDAPITRRPMRQPSRKPRMRRRLSSTFGATSSARRGSAAWRAVRLAAPSAPLRAARSARSGALAGRSGESADQPRGGDHLANICSVGAGQLLPDDFGARGDRPRTRNCSTGWRDLPVVRVPVPCSPLHSQAGCGWSRKP